MATNQVARPRARDELGVTLEMFEVLVGQYFFLLDRLNLPDAPREHPHSDEQIAAIEPGVLDLAEECLSTRLDERLLSAFLKAVRKSRDRAEGGDRQRLDRYLRNIAHLMLARPTALVPMRIMLQSTMETVLRADLMWCAHIEPRLGDLLAEDAMPHVSISLGDDDHLDVPFDHILQTFWTDALDSPCHECGVSFNGSEPPIRTVCLTPDSSEVPTSLPRPGVSANAPVLSFCIMNRHLACLVASGTTFVPVSHVWDEAIRTANALTPPAHHADGARVLVSAVHWLLISARHAYPPSTEFWHDYVSVPQWRPAVQQALLQQLPRIYSMSPEILVQLADFPQWSARWLLESRRSQGRRGRLMFHYMPPLTVLIPEFERSEWMARMWVALEFAQCQRAVLMDGSGKIWRSRDDESERDTFTEFVSGIWTLVTAMRRAARSFTHSLNIIQSGSLAQLIELKSEGLEGCLGHAMEFVASRQCFRFADRFIAIHTMVNRNSEYISPVPVDPDVAASCLWVWRHALMKRDFSPLMLQPRERRPDSEPPATLPSWLVGYNDLDCAEHDLGKEAWPPTYPEVTITERDGGRLQLQCLGTIKAIHYFDLAKSTEAITVCVAQLIDLILTQSSSLPSAQKVIGEFYRVFSMNVGVTEAARKVQSPKICVSYREHVDQDPEFDKKISQLLESYIASHDETARIRIAKAVGTLLQLDSGIPVLNGILTRYKTASDLADWREKRGALKGEPICELECPKCRGLSLCRLDLRPTAEVGDMVYKIPGLSYVETVENGVGLVLRAGRIVGRMLLGAHDCGCHGPEIVEVL